MVERNLAAIPPCATHDRRGNRVESWGHYFKEKEHHNKDRWDGEQKRWVVDREWDTRPHGTLGKVLMISGAAALFAGVFILPFGSSRARRDRNIRRIDDALRGLGVETRFSPGRDSRMTTKGAFSIAFAPSIRF